MKKLLICAHIKLYQGNKELNNNDTTSVKWLTNFTRMQADYITYQTSFYENVTKTLWQV